MKKNIYSEDFIKNLKKEGNTNWLKGIGWMTVVLFAGYKSINSAFKCGMKRGAGIVAEVTNEDYAIEIEEEEEN